jgi:hypothetical protein
MIATSAIVGTLVRVYSPSAISVIAISLSTEFLAPGTSTSPLSGPLRWTTIRSSEAPGAGVLNVTADQYAPDRHPVLRSSKVHPHH